MVVLTAASFWCRPAAGGGLPSQLHFLGGGPGGLQYGPHCAARPVRSHER
jgi:hypothetical protein